MQATREALFAFHRRRGKHSVCFAIVRTDQSQLVPEPLRHANSRITLDLYAQAGMPNKRLAQSKLVRMVLNKGEAQASLIELADSLEVLEGNGGDDGTRTRGLCRDRAAF